MYAEPVAAFPGEVQQRVSSAQRESGDGFIEKSTAFSQFDDNVEPAQELECVCPTELAEGR